MSAGNAESGRKGGRFGRQHEAERNDLAVLTAARETFAEQGRGASVAEIAKRAGVGMGTLYRRYGSKEEMLQHLCRIAIDQTISGLEDALERDGDGWNALTWSITQAVTERVGAFGPLAGTLSLPDDLVERNTRAHRLLEQLLDRGRRDGSIRADVTGVDVTRLIELFSRHPRGEDFAEQGLRRLLAVACAGLRPAEPALPGTPPQWDEYDAQWTAGSPSE